jgi:GNAT superfamily N-acetyltransferase
VASEMKRFGSFEVKDAARGEVEAVFATIGVTDHDKDIIRPSAIKHGAKVIVSSYGHDAVFGKRPAGKGHIFIDGNKAGVRAKMFLNTTDGRETFEVLKEMGEDQEWSFGFVVIDEEPPTEAERKSGARRALTKLDSFEVSPVIRGAGIGTRTLAVKQADGDSEVVEPVVEAAIEDPAPTGRIEDLFIDIPAAAKAAEDEAIKKEADRVAAETKAAAEAAESAAVASEFERITRNMRKWA